ncbi:MAG: hypothetical protein KC502_08845 [Myxococcales bacterium]|nr:hypothetical protein [Myxococcales bacterium]
MVERVEQDEAKGQWSAIVALFRDATPMTCSHWNSQTGDVFRVRSSRRQRALVEAFEERLFDEEGWCEVPFMESDDAFALMGDFAGDLAPGKGRSELLAALAQDKPFRGFRQILKKRPGLDRRWRKVADEEAAVRLVMFCLAQGLVMNHPEFRKAEKMIRAEWDAADRAEGLVAASGLSLGKRAK